MRTLDTETATVNLGAGIAVLTHTVPNAAALASLDILIGDGVNDLAAAAETIITVAVTIGGVPVRGEDITETVAAGRSRVRIPIDLFPIAAGETVVVTVTSDKAADSAVAVTATLYDAAPAQPATRGQTVDTGKVSGAAQKTDVDSQFSNTPGAGRGNFIHTNPSSAATETVAITKA